jgi:hypothetical protein
MVLLHQGWHIWCLSSFRRHALVRQLLIGTEAPYQLSKTMRQKCQRSLQHNRLWRLLEQSFWAKNSRGVSYDLLPRPNCKHTTPDWALHVTLLHAVLPHFMKSTPRAAKKFATLVLPKNQIEDVSFFYVFGEDLRQAMKVSASAKNLFNHNAIHKHATNPRICCQNTKLKPTRAGISQNYY